MAHAFDTLGFAQRLESGGVDRPHAEVHAEAARDFMMAEIATKEDWRDMEERLTLRLTVRLGGLIAAGVGALAILSKLL